MTTIRKHRVLVRSALDIVHTLQEGRTVEAPVIAEVLSSLIQALADAFVELEEQKREELPPSGDARRRQVERLGGRGLEF